MNAGFNSQYLEFVRGFAFAIGEFNLREADEQWAGFSRQLSDGERVRLEIGGWESGNEQGIEFRKLYPVIQNS